MIIYMDEKENVLLEDPKLLRLGAQTIINNKKYRVKSITSCPETHDITVIVAPAS